MLAKSKLNSTETLITQALIDMEISHKEFVTILKEKDKYEKMKENLRSENEKQEIMRLSGINEGLKWKKKKKKQPKIIEYFMLTKNLFISCVCIKCI